jgi:hypothetical protein
MQQKRSRFIVLLDHFGVLRSRLRPAFLPYDIGKSFVRKTTLASRAGEEFPADFSNKGLEVLKSAGCGTSALSKRDFRISRRALAPG